MFTWSDFTHFSKRVLADSNHFHFRWFHSLRIQNSSNCCRTKVWSNNFTNFFCLIFGGILQLGPNVLWCASEVRNELEAVNNEASTCHGARDWRQQPYVSALQEWSLKTKQIEGKKIKFETDKTLKKDHVDSECGFALAHVICRPIWPECKSENLTFFFNT